MIAAGSNPTVRLKNIHEGIAGRPLNWDDSDNIGPSHWPLGPALAGPEFLLPLSAPGFGSNGTFEIDGPLPGTVGARSNPTEIKHGHGYDWDVQTGAVTDLNPAVVTGPPVQTGTPPPPTLGNPLDALKSLVAGLPAPLNEPLVAGLAAFVVLRMLGGKRLF